MRVRAGFFFISSLNSLKHNVRMKEKIKLIVSKISFDRWAIVSAFLVFVLIFNYLFSVELRITPNLRLKQKLDAVSNAATTTQKPVQVVQQNVSATEVKLPIKWADLGKRLIESGVIDKAKF